MPVLRDDPVQLIAQEQVRLFSELRKLPEPVWQRPSKCDGWTIARVVAHLALSGAFHQQSVSKALRGDSLPPSLPGGQRLTAEKFVEQQIAKQEALAAKNRQDI